MRLISIFLFVFLASVARGQTVQTESVEFRSSPEVIGGLGFSVAMDDNWLAVGNHGGSGGVGGNGEGYVELFERMPNGWQFRQTIVSPDPGHGFQFGFDVDLREDLLVIGEPHWGYDPANSNGPYYLSGKAYLFERQGTQWNLILTLRPTIPQIQNGNFNFVKFGSCVALGYEKLAVGAPCENYNPTPIHSSGIVYTYKRVGNDWVWDQALYPPTYLEFQFQSSFGHFGGALDFDGNRLAIGAPIGGGGIVTTWLQSHAGWQRESILESPLPPTVGTERRFGRSVSLDGNFLAAGMTSGDCSGPVCRSLVAIHEFSGSNWTRVQVIDDINSEPGGQKARLGHRVELSGDHLAVGAPYFRINGFATGSVRLYERQPGQGFQLVKRFGIDNLVPGVGSGFLGWGLAADFERGSIVAGNHYYQYPSSETPEGYAQGAAFLFDVELGQDLACTGSDNTSGKRSHLAVTGSLSIAEDNLYLHGSHLPPNQLSLFLYAQPGPPFPIMQGGELCFSSPVSRMFPAGLVGSLGGRIMHVDLSTPREAQNLLPGTTWAFQAWHRDFSAGVSTTGTTNAVEVTFE